jgi:hypothetical protein
LSRAAHVPSSRIMSGRPWTRKDELALAYLGPRIGGVACAEAFDRTHVAICDKAHRLGIALKRKSVGRIKADDCGSPRIARRLVEIAMAPLCPACAKHPAMHRKTGLCEVCHWNALTAVHELEIAKRRAQQDLWKARSELYRLRQATPALELELVEM